MVRDAAVRNAVDDVCISKQIGFCLYHTLKSILVAVILSLLLPALGKGNAHANPAYWTCKNASASAGPLSSPESCAQEVIAQMNAGSSWSCDRYKLDYCTTPQPYHTAFIMASQCNVVIKTYQ